LPKVYRTDRHPNKHSPPLSCRTVHIIGRLATYQLRIQAWTTMHTGKAHLRNASTPTRRTLQKSMQTDIKIEAPCLDQMSIYCVAWAERYNEQIEICANIYHHESCVQASLHKTSNQRFFVPVRSASAGALIIWRPTIGNSNIP